MQKQLMMRTMVSTLIFTCIAMGIMIYYTAVKEIVIEEVTQDEMESGFGMVPEKEGNPPIAGELSMQKTEGAEKYLCIPVKESVKAEQVSIENDYMDRELWISIQGQPQDFYEKETVSGNTGKVIGGTYEYKEDNTLLKFRLTDVYEYRSTLNNNILYVELVSPREIYDKIVVIDAAGSESGSGLANSITLDIARRLKQKLDMTDVKAYYTRTKQGAADKESRVQIANATKADMLIGIAVNTSEDASQYGIEAVYNDTYFIPEFGSVELADLLERKVVTAVSNRGVGLSAAGVDDYVLQNAQVPAATVQVGYLTHDKEGKLLQKEDYRDKIADGIYQAILNAYEDYIFQ